MAIQAEMLKGLGRAPKAELLSERPNAIGYRKLI
jgi:hypothetical protein